MPWPMNQAPTMLTIDDHGEDVPPPRDYRCASCGLPVHELASAVQLWGARGQTTEHQACWQSRTFGEPR